MAAQDRTRLIGLVAFHSSGLPRLFMTDSPDGSPALDFIDAFDRGFEMKALLKIGGPASLARQCPRLRFKREWNLLCCTVGIVRLSSGRG